MIFKIEYVSEGGRVLGAAEKQLELKQQRHVMVPGGWAFHFLSGISSCDPSLMESRPINNCVELTLIASTGSYPSPTIELNSAGISLIKLPPLAVMVLLKPSMVAAPKTILSGKLLVGLVSWKSRNWISKPSLVGTVEISQAPAFTAALGVVPAMLEKNATDFATSELP
ncbi:hypothetical protein E6O75_ATG06721 [Venturia nashicola]|uniref:Uncharacterized protein n=1 Tax=Venturia nashicola TaxID=86259 RepID=A0A4Z1P4V3_9PEZI|nr:hypothetical protein E6O75_ATG06721 [Venturia nashicola]